MTITWYDMVFVNNADMHYMFDNFTAEQIADYLSIWEL